MICFVIFVWNIAKVDLYQIFQWKKIIKRTRSKYIDAIIIFSFVGSSYYVSPGVLQGKYDQRCDNWSLGVLLYLLLVGYPPFYDDNKQKLYEKIQTGTYSMSGSDWNNISEMAKDLIRKLLVVDRQKRLTITQALEHPWIKRKIMVAFQIFRLFEYQFGYIVRSIRVVFEKWERYFNFGYLENV
ncbi:hypothetical protein IMG5_115550 [Ichthyophthirius multifiliis]|uniref:Protein kinase domain-containing protein n=1 Tax=Ichthyophthirius multifiliis TaxID=5932 RepID=G0QU85_ICHMU|nr:hypothetical protein IMG5_115550 [Ichthyophthirius multifiliis]EGR31222.1 hypothetical protein IMG5_115550 [Ichthyophthirius multifiliis]|eukprot:XP_004034708.1 hypothetical protein IMG5_115550 [Ichthyophthirius multifiliis]